MATTRIKQKLSQIVSSQFPEFVQSDYQKFISFFEAYYKFLEQDQNPQELIQNILEYNNIDFTTTAFIKYFLKNYSDILPDTLLADKKLAVKRIKDLYEAKGSTLSFQLFFRLVFNQETSVNFPYENVLIPSGGNFLQRRSLRLSTATGDRSNILNRFLTSVVDNQEFNTPILEVNNINDELTELFLDVNFLAPSYSLNQTLTVTDATEGGNVVYTGNVEPTTTSVSVTQAGTGFKKGQVFSINEEEGVGTRILISNVTSTGGVNKVDILAFGHSYARDFSVQLSNNLTVAEILPTLTINDSTNGFLSHGNIFHTGNGQVIANFGNNTSVTTAATSNRSALDSSKSVVSFTLGALARFKGEFTTNKGFLSDPDIRVQDSLLYQPFAYQLVTGLDINNFRDVVLDTIHPAGQRLFNNRELSDLLDVRSNVSTESFDTLILNFFDRVDVDDSNVGLETGIGLVDTSDGFVDSGTISSNSQSYFANTYCVVQDPSDPNSYIAGTTEHF